MAPARRHTVGPSLAPTLGLAKDVMPTAVGSTCRLLLCRFATECPRFLATPHEKNQITAPGEQRHVEIGVSLSMALRAASLVSVWLRPARPHLPVSQHCSGRSAISRRCLLQPKRQGVSAIGGARARPNPSLKLRPNGAPPGRRPALRYPAWRRPAGTPLAPA
jgi:hypothetical protein